MEAAVQAAVAAAEAAMAAEGGGANGSPNGHAHPPPTIPPQPPATPATPLPSHSHATRASPPQRLSELGDTDADVALRVLRPCAHELHSTLGLRPVARATAPWGRGKAGVVVSSLAYALQHAPPGQSDLVGAILFEAGAASALFHLLAAARVAGDDAGREGCLWCIASLAHLCGGRALRLADYPDHETGLFSALTPPPSAATSTSTNAAGSAPTGVPAAATAAAGAPASGAPSPATASVLLALAALRAAAADPLTVRRVARQLKRVQELFRSDVTDVALLACAVVANVEQYSHARLWYARSHAEATQLLDAPAPPPPPPLVLYSQAPVPPALLVDMGATAHAAAGAAAGAASSDVSDGGVLSVPQLACQLHPWILPALRRSAVLRLAATLLAAWQRGTHDAVLLYLLEASLVPRRLGFVLSRDFANDDHAGYAHCCKPLRDATRHATAPP